MQLTGKQIGVIAEMSEGKDAVVIRPGRMGFVDMTRIEDGLRIRIFDDGVSYRLDAEDEKA